MLTPLEEYFEDCSVRKLRNIFRIHDIETLVSYYNENPEALISMAEYIHLGSKYEEELKEIIDRAKKKINPK